MEHVTLFYIFC